MKTKQSDKLASIKMNTAFIELPADKVILGSIIRWVGIMVWLFAL